MLFEGQSLTCKMLDDGIAEFCFDLKQQSINKFDQPAFKEFKQIVELLQNASELKGVLVTSAKNVFIVGADITEFLTIFKNTEQQIQDFLKDANDIFNGFEDLEVPTVVAINGIALGGGLADWSR